MAERSFCLEGMEVEVCRPAGDPRLAEGDIRCDELERGEGRHHATTVLCPQGHRRKGPGAHETSCSDELRVSPPNITGVVDRLEKKGLVRREEGSTDRRRKEIHLTTKGEDLYREGPRGYSEWLQGSLRRRPLRSRRYWDAPQEAREGDSPQRSRRERGTRREDPGETRDDCLVDGH